MFAAGESVTRLRAPLKENVYSNKATERDWSAAVSLTIGDCAFNPGQSSEPVVDARNAVITRPEVYAPFDADILATDRLVVRGRTYSVDGEPAPWRSPFSGWEPGLVVRLKIVEG